MTTHISDDDLVLYHYGEPASGDAGQHIAACDECRARLDALAAILEHADADAIPEPGPGYEDLVWQRLKWQARGQRRAGIPKSLQAAAAAAVLIAIGFAGGRLIQNNHPQVQPTVAAQHQAAPPPAKDETAQAPVSTISLAAQKHIDRSSRLLLDVTNSNHATDSDVRGSAEQLLASNRVYRLMAARSGAGEVAKLLEDIEPILTELAHTGANAKPEELTSIRKRIRDRELLFKLRVIQQTLQQHDNESKAVSRVSSNPLS